MSVHVAQLIADAIYQFVGTTPMRHPVDPEKCNRALGFPARITGLYQFYRVSVAPSEVIRPPVTRAFIEKYCMPRLAQGEAPQQPRDDQQQAAGAPPPPPESTFDHLRRLERYIRHVADQQAANHRGQVRLHKTFYQYTHHQQG